MVHSVVTEQRTSPPERSAWAGHLSWAPGLCPHLQFTEMVLRLLDTGAEAVLDVDGIDAMEAIQVRRRAWGRSGGEEGCRKDWADGDDD